MFTGIISDVGTVRAVEQRGDTRISIATRYDITDIALGASIACHGVCLTVVGTEGYGDGGVFYVDASTETLAKTCLKGWAPGTRVNLERALCVGDELGGHIVTGHVDAVGRIIDMTEEGDSRRFRFAAPRSLAPFIAPKGSIAINGASLTVNEVTDHADSVVFGVNIIPHTQTWTTFGIAKPEERVNLEIDVLARYVGRLKETFSA